MANPGQTPTPGSQPDAADAADAAPPYRFLRLTQDPPTLAAVPAPSHGTVKLTHDERSETQPAPDDPRKGLTLRSSTSQAAPDTTPNAPPYTANESQDNPPPTPAPESVDIIHTRGKRRAEALEDELSEYVEQEDCQEHPIFRCKVPECTKPFIGRTSWRKHVENSHQDLLRKLRHPPETSPGLSPGYLPGPSSGASVGPDDTSVLALDRPYTPPPSSLPTARERRLQPALRCLMCPCMDFHSAKIKAGAAWKSGKETWRCEREGCWHVVGVHEA